MQTYTRIEAAANFGVSNTIIARNLKALEDMGFLALTENNRLTERAIYLIELYRAKDFSMLDDELECDRLALDPLQSDVCDTDIEPIAPAGYALAPIQSSEYAIAPVAAFDASAYEMQADSALAQWQAMQSEMGARAAQMQANNEQMQGATQAAARNMAAQMLMGMSMELSQQLAAGMPLVQAQALQMMMGKSAAATSQS